MIWSKCRPLACLVLALGLATAASARAGEVLGPVMAGEFALQAGDLAQAAAHYLRAAESSADPGLAERATRIALLAERPALAADALARWRMLAPAAPALAGAGLELALQSGDRVRAREAALALLGQPEREGQPVFVGLLGGARGARRAVALQTLDDLVASERLPDGMGSWLALAAAARRLDREDLAGRLVQEGAERFPDDPRALLLDADQLRRAGRDDDARLRLDGLGDAEALAPEVRRAAARLHALLGDPVSAARMLARGPQDEATRRERARLLLEAGDLPALAALYEELRTLEDAPPPERSLLLGMLAERLGRWHAAENWYASVPRGAGYDQARLRRAAALARLGRQMQAQAALESLQDDPDADGEFVRDAYLLEAELVERGGDPAAALGALDRGLALFEGDPALLYARALLQERRGRVEDGLADLRRILDEDPDSAQALNAYGYMLLVRRDDALAALPYLERAHALAPDSAAVLDSLGWARFRLGERAQALALLERAWARGRSPEIAAHLGEVLWREGRRDEARAVWRQGLALSTDDTTLNQTLDRLLENRTP